MVDIKEVAKKVIADEALAIQNLARFIDDDCFEFTHGTVFAHRGRSLLLVDYQSFFLGKACLIAYIYSQRKKNMSRRQRFGV